MSLERGPRRPLAGAGWSALALPLAVLAVACSAYGGWAIGLLCFALAVATWIKAWAAFTGITHVGPR